MREATLLPLALVACTLTIAQSSSDTPSGNVLTIEGLEVSIPKSLIVDTVVGQRAWLGTFMCPEQTMLLRVGPEAGFAPRDRALLLDSLTSDGCSVVENTPEMRNSYLNPARDEWRRDRYKGAFIGHVGVGAKVVQDESNLAITIGWYKGEMSAKSSTLLYRWDGTKWVKRTDLTIVTVS